MANTKAPSLRLHAASGQWCCLWAGKMRYLGKDEREAQRRYADELAAWTTWRASLNAARASTPYVPSTATAVAERPSVKPSKVSGPLVSDACAKLLEKIETEASAITHKGSAARLKLFSAKFGSRPLSSLSPDDLLSWRAGLIKAKYAPNSINPALVLVRRVLVLAYETGMVEVPVRGVALLKSVPIGAVPDKSWTPKQVSALLALVAEHRPNLARLLWLQYVCCLRPSEVGRLAYRQGEWHRTAEGCFVLSESKTQRKTGERRVVIMPPAAVEVFARTEPECETFSALLQAAKKVSVKIGEKKLEAILGREDFSPHPFRHSSQTSLVESKVRGELIDAACGHVLPKVKRVYRPLPLEAARKAMGVLVRLVPPPKGI